ncbi:hypothetical protein RJ55_06923 [Drechmeria coniospora]|nr:hypothetical protein RJ55_06923 [Drechmeria coniospora]
MALRRFAIAALWATGTAVSLVSAASYDHVNSTAELPVIVKRDVIPDDNSWVKLYIVAHLCCVEGFRCASKESVSRQVDIMNEKLAMAKIWFDILLVEWVTDERCGRTNVGDRWGTDELKRGFYVGDARVLNFLYLPNNQGDGAKGLSWDANPYAYDANMLGNLDGCTVAMDTLPGMDEGDDNQPAANPPARLGSGSGILSDLWSGVTRFFSRDLHEAHTGLARRGYLKETEWVSVSCHECGHWLGQPHWRGGLTKKGTYNMMTAPIGFARRRTGRSSEQSATGILIRTRARARTRSCMETGARTRTETGTRTRLETGTRTRLETGTRTRLEAGTRTRMEAGTRTRMEADTRVETGTESAGGMFVPGQLAALHSARHDMSKQPLCHRL